MVGYLLISWLLLASGQTDVLAQGSSGESTSVSHVKQAAETYIATHYPSDAYRLDVRIKRVSGTIEEGLTLRLAFPSETELPRGTVQVKLFTEDQEVGWQRAGWALLYIAHFDSLLLAHDRIERDAELTWEDTQVAWMETTAFRGEPLRPGSFDRMTVQGPVYATRLLQEGRALRLDDVRPAYATDTGETVVMQYRKGRLAFDLACKAREPGFLEDTIRLYSPDTGKNYRARLTEPGKAVWIETY